MGHRAAKRGLARGRGRPGTGEIVVTREAIVRTALELLESGGLKAITMRALARELSVDPMTPYHYFPDKDALLAAAAEWAYATLRPRMSRMSANKRKRDWRQRLTSLARAYLRFLSRSGELLRYVARRSAVASASARHFDELFVSALGSLSLDEAHRIAARNAFVDLLHGYSLAAGAVNDATLTAELAILFAGIQTFGRAKRIASAS